MTNKPIRSRGYSKKELLEIIEEIDSSQQQIKKQTESVKKAGTSERKKKTEPVLY